MILRRYGSNFQEVEPNFDARALTEIGFRRTHGRAVPLDEFERDYQQVSTQELDGTAAGDVHDEVETRVLAGLRARLDEVHASLGTDEVLVIESEQGLGHPKTRSQQRSVVIDGENRLHFSVRIEPALRVGVYRRRG